MSNNPPEQTQSPGADIDGRYRLLHALGEGAHSVVYLAHQASLDRHVAVKVIDTSGPRWFETSGRALREAKLIAELVHPNIVTVYDCGCVGQRPYIVMEHVRGRTLDAELREHGRLAPSAALELFIQLARALAAAHRQRVVHRDVKPSNVLLAETDDGGLRAKLTDFGIASHGQSEVAPDGLVLGTPAYMAPEQARGLPVDGRADLYSLGVLMFRALTGHAPFTGRDAHALAVKHMTTPVPWFRDVDAGVRVPAQLEAVVRRCMAKHPRNRYPSADALIDDLEQVELSSQLWRVAQATLRTIAAHLLPRGTSRLAQNHLSAALILGITASAACVAVLVERPAGATVQSDPASRLYLQSPDDELIRVTGARVAPGAYRILAPSQLGMVRAGTVDVPPDGAVQIRCRTTPIRCSGAPEAE